MARLNNFLCQVLPKMMRKNVFFFRVLPKVIHQNSFFFRFLPKMMRRRVPRWPRLLELQDQNPQPQNRQEHPHPLPQQQQPPQSQPPLEEEQQPPPRKPQSMRKPQHLLRLQRLQQQRLQRQQRRSQVDVDACDDDDNTSSHHESSYGNRRHVTRRLRLPFSFQTRAATPAKTPAWDGNEIPTYVADNSVSSRSSDLDDDSSVPTQLEVSENEELWSDIEESSSSDDEYNEEDSDDAATVYSIHIVATDHALELVTHQESASMKNGPTETMDDEDTIPNTSDLIANSCLSIIIGRDLLDTYADASDACCQVLHAFTLGEQEINCVCGSLENAKNELSNL